jgi:RAT1-interacting protein
LVLIYFAPLISTGGGKVNKYPFCYFNKKFQVLHECNFVCWRGLLTRIASMPFEKGVGEGNKIACCLFNGVVFMCEFDTELKITKLENESDSSKQMSYWGFKFEQYVTTDDPEVSGYFY